MSHSSTDVQKQKVFTPPRGLVFSRPLWLEFTAFALIMMGMLGHVSAVWRLSLGLGNEIKRDVLGLLLNGFRYFLDEQSFMVQAMREGISVLNTFLAQPVWFRSWYNISGLLELVISTAYFFLALFFWTKKKWVVPIFYYVISMGIVVHLISVFASLIISEGLGVMKMVLDAPIFIISVVLIVIVKHADKSVFDVRARDLVDFGR